MLNTSTDLIPSWSHQKESRTVYLNEISQATGCTTYTLHGLANSTDQYTVL